MKFAGWVDECMSLESLSLGGQLLCLLVHGVLQLGRPVIAVTLKIAQTVFVTFRSGIADFLLLLCRLCPLPRCKKCVRRVALRLRPHRICPEQDDNVQVLDGSPSPSSSDSRILTLTEMVRRQRLAASSLDEGETLSGSPLRSLTDIRRRRALKVGGARSLTAYDGVRSPLTHVAAEEISIGCFQGLAAGVVAVLLWRLGWPSVFVHLATLAVTELKTKLVTGIIGVFVWPFLSIMWKVTAIWLEHLLSPCLVLVLFAVWPNRLNFKVDWFCAKVILGVVSLVACMCAALEVAFLCPIMCMVDSVIVSFLAMQDRMGSDLPMAQTVTVIKTLIDAFPVDSLLGLTLSMWSCLSWRRETAPFKVLTSTGSVAELLVVQELFMDVLEFVVMWCPCFIATFLAVVSVSVLKHPSPVKVVAKDKRVRLSLTQARRCKRKRFCSVRRHSLQLVHNPSKHGQCLWSCAAVLIKHQTGACYTAHALRRLVSRECSRLRSSPSVQDQLLLDTMVQRFATKHWRLTLPDSPVCASLVRRYVQETSRTRWGSTDDLALISSVLRTHGVRVDMKVFDKSTCTFDNGDHLAAAHDLFIVYHNYHFTVERRGRRCAHQHQARSAFLVKKARSWKCAAGKRARSTPTVAPPPPPKTTLVYHGTFGPCHPGHGSVVRSGVAALKGAGLVTVSMWRKW
eukprot:590230-Amphidinium_carterae.1